jgi:DNA primase
VLITHPEKPYFSKQHKIVKLQFVQYYSSVAEGALQGFRRRRLVLKRFVDGAEAPPFL